MLLLKAVIFLGLIESLVSICRIYRAQSHSLTCILGIGLYTSGGVLRSLYRRCVVAGVLWHSVPRTKQSFSQEHGSYLAL